MTRWYIIDRLPSPGSSLNRALSSDPIFAIFFAIGSSKAMVCMLASINMSYSYLVKEYFMLNKYEKKEIGCREWLSSVQIAFLPRIYVMLPQIDFSYVI